ncbi:MAG: chemotaxis protein CheW [Elusimicrobiota bacterium]|jgi:two-component system chemotaxis sensor kinase CheA
MKNELRQELEGLLADLATVTVHDRDNLFALGAKLETFTASLPIEESGLVPSLQFCLKGLESVFVGAIRPEAILDSVRDVLRKIIATSQILTTQFIGGSFNDVVGTLQQILSDDLSKVSPVAANDTSGVRPSADFSGAPAVPPTPLNDLDGLIKDFLTESRENLDHLDRDFVTLEKNPQDRQTLDSIFRTIHTIKGTSGFLGFSKLGAITHVGENLLGRLREGALLLDKDLTDALLSMVDAVRQILGSIETVQTEGSTDYKKLIERLSAIESVSDNPSPTPERKPIQKSTENSMTNPEPVFPMPPHDEGFKMEHLDPAVLEKRAEPPTAKPVVKETTASSPEQVAPAEGKGDDVPKSGGVDRTIRVGIELLDKVMDLVGELVLARNQIMQVTSGDKSNAMTANTQRLNLVTTELQEKVMKTRMQPIENIWGRFPRIVRDLAASLGKKVRLEMEGEDTELDKTLIEAIKDPLTHLVRNSVDHGIEKADVRREAGKAEEGRIFLRAYHEGGQVNIEISDDGRGLDFERIRDKAIQKGILSADQAARMSESELVNLIFLPGFSTAEKITQVSGRGVGMDVVKTNIEKIGGTIDVQSRRGEGATVKVKIPLTLAIIPALLVKEGGDRYAIPQANLLECVRLEGEQMIKGIEQIHGAPVYRLRGNLLPLVYLSRELKVGSKTSGHGDLNRTSIIVLQADTRQFGLVVDDINDTLEIVVKPLGKHLKGLSTFAGATIMGDGQVALILDVLGLAQRASVISDSTENNAIHDQESSLNKEGIAGEAQTLLICSIANDRRLAIPLTQVTRLEEFSLKGVERADNRDVVQYRGRIMPLLYLSEALNSRPGRRHRESTSRVLENSAGQGAKIQVVVHTQGDRDIGFVTERIIDIVDQRVVVKSESHRPGVLYYTVIQEKVTELVDAEALVRMFDSGGETQPPASAMAGRI